MTQVKSFILNKKGFCVVNTNTGIYLYTPNKNLKDVNLPQLQKILVSEVGSNKDVGMVEDVLNICSSWGNNHVFHSSPRS